MSFLRLHRKPQVIVNNETLFATAQHTFDILPATSSCTATKQRQEDEVEDEESQNLTDKEGSGPHVLWFVVVVVFYIVPVHDKPVTSKS